MLIRPYNVNTWLVSSDCWPNTMSRRLVYDKCAEATSWNEDMLTSFAEAFIRFRKFKKTRPKITSTPRCCPLVLTKVGFLNQGGFPACSFSLGSLKDLSFPNTQLGRSYLSHLAYGKKNNCHIVPNYIGELKCHSVRHNSQLRGHAEYNKVK